MRHLDLWLEKYRERAVEIQDELEQYGYWVAGLRKRLEGIRITQPVKEVKSMEKACFIDGGEGLHELLGFGIYFTRATGIIGNGEGYGFLREMDLNVIEHGEFMKEYVELQREIQELNIALKAVDEGCERIVLDGSLFVKSSIKLIDHPESGEYIEKLRLLTDLCREKNISLMGVSEDSKSRLLTRKLSIQMDLAVPSSLTDSTLLRIIGGDGVFQTDVFQPRIKTHLKGCSGTCFPTAYLQPTRISNPLRIDFLEGEENIRELLGWIYGLSKSSKSYGFPLPLYLAHVDSHLKSKHVEWTSRQIIKQALKTQPELGDALLRDTRKNSRPED